MPFERGPIVGSQWERWEVDAAGEKYTVTERDVMAIGGPIVVLEEQRTRRVVRHPLNDTKDGTPGFYKCFKVAEEWS